MAKTNLLAAFNTGGWMKMTDQVKNTIHYADDYSCAFKATDEGDYIRWSGNNALAGKKLELGWSSFSCGDGRGWINVRLYAEDGSYTNAVSHYSTDVATKYVIEAPAGLTELRIYVRHDWDSDGFPETEIAIQGMYLYDTATQSQTAINFHKTLNANLPGSVTPGTEHIYMTTDGSTVNMYISNKEGKIIPVGLAGGSGQGEEAAYYNAYTQAWIDERKEEIRALQMQGDCITLLILADIHVREAEDADAGRYNRARDFQMLTEQIATDYICCEGDLMSYCAAWDGSYEPRIEKLSRILRACRAPFFATRGNHDYNSDDYNPGGNPNILDYNDDTHTALCVTNREWHRSITARMPETVGMKVVVDAERPTYGYFYVDDFAQKHRMIYVNTFEVREDSLARPYENAQGKHDEHISGVQTAHQIRFLVDKAMDMAGREGWVVTFHSHMAPYTDAAEDDKSEFHGYGSDLAQLRHIVKCFQNGTALTDYAYSCLDVDSGNWGSIMISRDFSAQGPVQVAGWFCGHIHDDCYRKVEGLDILVSTCTCEEQRKTWTLDASPTKLPPVRDTLQNAMSVNAVIINKSLRRVNVVKLGSKRDNADKTSSDLTWTY